MKKTGFVWFMLVVAVINVVLAILSLTITVPGTEYAGNAALGYLGTLIGVVGIIISVIFIYKLFKMTNDILKWTNTTFGYDVFSMIFSSVVVYINSNGTNPTTAIISNVIVLIIILVIWSLFNKHLKKITSPVI